MVTKTYWILKIVRSHGTDDSDGHLLWIPNNASILIRSQILKKIINCTN